MHAHMYLSSAGAGLDLISPRGRLPATKQAFKRSDHVMRLMQLINLFVRLCVSSGRELE